MSAHNWLSWTAALRDYLAFLNGDAAYARYLAHWHHTHSGDDPLLDRGQFLQAELERRWNNIRRCC
jgi:uncharacterized short protein YbdD (DUF466 family)